MIIEPETPIAPQNLQSASIPRRYWIAIIAPLVIGGAVIGIAKVRSSDEYLRSRLIGKWRHVSDGSVVEFRDNGTSKVTWFGVLSFAGTWRVKDEFIYVIFTHGDNMLTDVLAAPERWINGRAAMNVKTRVSLLDTDHMKVTDGVWERIKEAP